MTDKMKDEKFIAQLKEVNRKAAEDCLNVVLELGGYYVKAAQTMCGARVLPEGFDEVFAVLLDDCPRSPSKVIKAIIEEELGMELLSSSRTLKRRQLLQRQLDKCTLRVSRMAQRYAVKVQYPEVEKFFKMDVRTVGWMMTMAGMKSQVKEIFAAMEKQLEHEFDYTCEAGVMREVSNNVTPIYGELISIPKPIDDEYVRTSQCGARKSLCTRKVLTMSVSVARQSGNIHCKS